MKIQIKRVYERALPADGFRVLVDRLWPRGLSKSRVNYDVWLKEIAPTTDLRKWFDHDARKWDEFTAKYREQLQAKHDLIRGLIDLDHDTVTLLYAAKDEHFNHAVVLRDFISGGMKR